MPRRHFAAAILLVLGVSAASAGQTPQAPVSVSAANFTVFVQGQPIGSEQVAVTATSAGWVIRSSGRLGNPINLATNRFEMRYDASWHPLSMDIEGSLRGQPMLLHTVVTAGAAASEINQAGQVAQKSDKIAPDALFLPNMLFGAYEALAVRVKGMTLPADLRAYIAPQAEIPLKVNASSDERIRTVERTIAAKRYTLTFVNPEGPVDAELWVDEESHILRFRVPAQGLEVARDDVAAVSSRVERLGRPNDETVHVPGNGFSLVGTLSKPAGALTGQGSKGAKAPDVRLPTVILIPGSGPVDRDETIAGIAIFAQVATRLADAGFAVVRYDKRGVGQSGGREESSTIRDFADDVRAVVEFLRRRKDVDPDRIALVGHSEGGLVGLLAASEAGKRVAALVLLATPGTPGGTLILEQQEHLLGRMTLPPGEVSNRMDLQRRIQTAVLTGDGWENIPPAYRHQADTPWFKSFLSFDPAQSVRRVSQPLLVVQGSLDRQVAPVHATRLADLARARKNNPGVDVVLVDGVNHLFVQATTGETDEYPMLKDQTVSPRAVDPAIAWLKDKLHVGSASSR
jgi:uncharacterized protein